MQKKQNSLHNRDEELREAFKMFDKVVYIKIENYDTCLNDL